MKGRVPRLGLKVAMMGEGKGRLASPGFVRDRVTCWDAGKWPTEPPVGMGASLWQSVKSQLSHATSALSEGNGGGVRMRSSPIRRSSFI